MFHFSKGTCFANCARLRIVFNINKFEYERFVVGIRRSTRFHEKSHHKEQTICILNTTTQK